MVYCSLSWRVTTYLHGFNGNCMRATVAAGEAANIAAWAASPLAWIWVRMPNRR